MVYQKYSDAIGKDVAKLTFLRKSVQTRMEAGGTLRLVSREYLGYSEASKTATAAAQSLKQYVLRVGQTDLRR